MGLFSICGTRLEEKESSLERKGLGLGWTWAGGGLLFLGLDRFGDEGSFVLFFPLLYSCRLAALGVDW